MSKTPTSPKEIAKTNIRYNIFIIIFTLASCVLDIPRLDIMLAVICVFFAAADIYLAVRTLKKLKQEQQDLK